MIPVPCLEQGIVLAGVGFGRHPGWALAFFRNGSPVLGDGEEEDARAVDFSGSTSKSVDMQHPKLPNFRP